VDAVLPICVKDLERAKLLVRSLVYHAHDLATLWVITPPADVRIAQERLGPAVAPVRMRVLPETDVVPELRVFRLRGWEAQQLIKLAMADRVESDFYLTLDADVICTRRVALDRLIHDGRAPMHVIDEDVRPAWYAWAADVLGLAPIRQHIFHNVTPTLLSRAGVLALAQHLDRRWRRFQLATGRRSLGNLRHRLRFAAGTRGLEPWRLYLCLSTPWTEYGLYYTFLEATGRFGKFHTETRWCLYDVEQSIWYAKEVDLDSWDPSPAFRGEGPPYFLVFQSNTGIDPAFVGSRIEPLLGLPSRVYES
jgi:uncharacterized protein DUF6492